MPAAAAAQPVAIADADENDPAAKHPAAKHSTPKHSTPEHSPAHLHHESEHYGGTHRHSNLVEQHGPQQHDDTKQHLDSGKQRAGFQHLGQRKVRGPRRRHDGQRGGDGAGQFVATGESGNRFTIGNEFAKSGPVVAQRDH